MKHSARSLRTVPYGAFAARTDRTRLGELIMTAIEIPVSITPDLDWSRHVHGDGRTPVRK